MATAAAVIRVPFSHERPAGVNFVRLAFQFLLMTVCLVGVGISADPLLAIALVAVGLLPWLWSSPVRGLYLMVAAAALIEIYRLNFPDSLTDRVALFLNLNNSSGADVPITPAEILILVIGAGALFKAAGDRRPLTLGPGVLLKPYLIFISFVLLAEFHGLLSGGDFKVSLWELRPVAYAFIFFLLGAALIQTRQQLVTLIAIFMFAMVVKVLLADYRYFVTLGRDLGGLQAILGHEDSYFIAMFLVASGVALAWGLHARIFILLSAVTVPLAAAALLANQRRIGEYALGAAAVVVLSMAYAFEPRMRRPVLLVSVVLAVGLGGLIAASWNDQYGFRGQLVRPVRSFFDPTVRDFSSDIYRTAENGDLRLSFQSDPFIGMGFGKPFLAVFPLADISQIYPLWNVIPHNTLLWVGVRMGVFGFAAFWALIGMAVLQAFSIARARSDPLIRAVAIFSAAAIVAELVVAYGDLQLENERNMIFFGVVLGLLNRLGALPDAAASETAPDESQPAPTAQMENVA